MLKVLPPNPTQWALRAEEHTGHLVLICRNHEHDHWRDVATASSGSSLLELIVERMNAAATTSATGGDTRPADH